MSEFTHSIVLFTGDDGLPLVFNIQYAANKEILRDMIEFGGGVCTLSDDSIYLVSPGTKVLNVDPSKKLLSSKYVYDCIKQNYLLETDEYRFEINEMETSDISDNSLNLVDQDGRKLSDDIIDNSLDLIDPNKAVSPSHLTCPVSNHDFDFEDSEHRTNFTVVDKKGDYEINDAVMPVQYLETFVKTGANGKTSDNNPTPDSLEDHQTSFNEGNLVDDNVCDMEVNEHMSDGCSKDVINNVSESPVNAVIVSSSQPDENPLDQFDNMILYKAHENPTEKNDESMSQSYTVSSSADAQVSPKVASHNISAEIFGASSDAPDSASQTTERQQYINNLEKEIEQILQKPSPKSIQDKIILVKYICTVKKLAPAVVLQTLRNLCL